MGWFIFFDGVASVFYTITWSLSVEEFSYVLIGLAALVSRRALPGFLIFVSLFSIGLRFYLNTMGHADIYHFPLARVDSIAIGGVMAWLITTGRSVIGALVAGIFASVLLRYLGGAFAPTFLYTLVTFLTCLAIAISEKWLIGYRGTLATAYARVGFYSYFIYLYHFMVLEAQLMTERYLGIDYVPFWLNAAICLGLSQVAAMLSFRFFEGPLLMLGRRLETQGSSHIAQARPK
jgi:peptidoglycan/LPS O-acetylase OafA/YrhL